MTRHSKNCTAHSVYTYHERKKDQRETNSDRLGKDSIKRFDCCCLTLQSAKDPVVTTDGFLYDRQAILEYIVNSKADIQRKLKLFEKKKSREDQRIKDIENTKRTEQMKTFLESSNPVPSHSNLIVSSDKLKTAENSYKPGSLTDFWSPGLAENTDVRDKITDADRPDTVVRCPMSRKPLKYKELIPVNFCKFKKDDESKSVDNNIYCCSLTKDIITDATPCVVLKTSGCIVTEEAFETLVRKDMIDPINGKVLKKDDVIPLFRGSLGYSDERILLQAYSPVDDVNLPRIPVSPSKIHILESPTEFYETLIEYSAKAKRRIVLSTLYIGTGSMEMKFINTIREAAKSKCSITVLLEYTRGTRNNLTSQKYLGSNQNSAVDSKQIYTNSKDLLYSALVKNCTTACDVYLYHSPELRGWKKAFTSDRVNEIFQLQHIKAYVIDDTVILSGANLSKDYFTNRQDRAWIIKDCPQLADYYETLIKTIGKMSYKLNSDGDLVPANDELDPATTDLSKYIQEFSKSVSQFLKKQVHISNDPNRVDSSDTILIPTVQMGPYNINQDWDLLTKILASLKMDSNKENFTIDLASGYFCPNEDLEAQLIDLVKSKFCERLSVIAASPKVSLLKALF